MTMCCDPKTERIIRSISFTTNICTYEWITEGTDRRFRIRIPTQHFSSIRDRNLSHEAITSLAVSHGITPVPLLCSFNVRILGCFRLAIEQLFFVYKNYQYKCDHVLLKQGRSFYSSLLNHPETFSIRNASPKTPYLNLSDKLY